MTRVILTFVGMEEGITELYITLLKLYKRVLSFVGSNIWGLLENVNKVV